MFLFFSVLLKKLFTLNQTLLTQVDFLLGMRFLNDTTYSITEQVLTFKLNGSLIQAIRIHD